MPAAPNQDFITYIGDSVAPIFTVLDANNNPVNISGVTDISWSAQRNLTDPAILTKTLSGGGISLVGGGTTGQFQVSILTSDLSVASGISGWYMHKASLIQGANVTTCTVGRMQVGQSPNWTWDPGSVGIEDLYTVRSLIGDTNIADQQLADQQIKWTISEYSNVWLAAAECCRMIAGWYARRVDTSEGLLRTTYSSQRKAYQSLAADLENRGMARGGVTAYTGGTSIADKALNVQNTDRKSPQFVLAQWDNILPEFPVGHQVGVADAQGAEVDDSGIGGLP